MNSTFDPTPKAVICQTPVGPYPGPMNPAFRTQLLNCTCDEDLFKLVESNGFINPDAFNEVNARRLYGKYAQWKRNQKS